MKKKLLTLLLGLVLSTNFIIQANASSAKGWVQSSTGAWSYTKTDGTKATGWLKDGIDWYYFWSNGEMATGWVQGNGTWYYLASNGAMATNTVVDGCYLDANGAWTSRPSGNIYTGAEIKDKVRTLGFLDENGGMTLNPNGVSGSDQTDYMCFNVLSGKNDMSIGILCTNSEVEQKVPVILNWILPTQGNYLNSVLSDSNLKSQTLELDGRTVTINSQQRFLSVAFGPIK